MLLAKASLAGLLLENGEEDLAVLVVRSDLPEQLDTELHGAQLEHIGLGSDDLQALLPPVTPHGARTPSTLDEEEVVRIERTISARWADLVQDWMKGDAPGR